MFSRKVAPAVKQGKVQKKHNHTLTETYYHPLPTSAGPLIIERHNPGKGFRHVVSKDELARFISIIPEWRMLSTGLHAIILAPGDEDASGYYYRGVIHLCAWDEDLWCEYSSEFFNEHKDILARLGVPFREEPERVTCFFSEETAKAYHLLHIFLHELGHHRDRMTSKRAISSRGEDFAERYARQYELVIWQRYKEHFGFHGLRRPAAMVSRR